MVEIGVRNITFTFSVRKRRESALEYNDAQKPLPPGEAVPLVRVAEFAARNEPRNRLAYNFSLNNNTLWPDVAYDTSYGDGCSRA